MIEYRYRLSVMECTECGHLIELSRATTQDPEKVFGLRELLEATHECHLNPGPNREPIEPKYQRIRVLRPAVPDARAAAMHVLGFVN